MKTEIPIRQRDQQLESDVRRAQAGDRAALEAVLRAVQPDVYGVALRFLWHPQDAEDATQEILLRVANGFGGFRGESGFRTWCYRVACNALSTMGKKRMEERSLSFDALGEDLAQGLSDDAVAVEVDADRALLLEEVRIGCTLAMLLCLDREHRLAYILGEILELNHRVAAEVLEVSPAAFRKRVSRARASITSFMQRRCGLANPDNPCRCRRRVSTAVRLGRVDPAKLLFASSVERARRFPRLLGMIRQLEATQRSAALYRCQLGSPPPGDLVTWLEAGFDDRAAREP